MASKKAKPRSTRKAEPGAIIITPHGFKKPRFEPQLIEFCYNLCLSDIHFVGREECMPIRRGKTSYEFHWKATITSLVTKRKMPVMVVVGEQNGPPWVEQVVIDFLFDSYAYVNGLAQWAVDNESTPQEQHHAYVETLRRFMRFANVLGDEGLQQLLAIERW